MKKPPSLEQIQMLIT